MGTLYWVPKCKILCLNFEGEDGATTWEEEAQGLTPVNNYGFTISTTRSKFGGSSLKGSGGAWSLLRYRQNPETFTRGDLTAHGWVSFSGISSWTNNGVLALLEICDGFQLYLVKETGQSLKLRTLVLDPNSSDLLTINVDNPFANDQWYHLAAVASGRNISYYINGSVQGTWDYSYDNPLESTEFYISINATINATVSVWWDAWEVVNYAKWTDVFTPPTSSPPLENPLGFGWQSGNWNDKTHWSYESGGDSTGRVIPDKTYNVIFNENSFPSSGGVVDIVGGAICKSMSWEGVVNNPALRFILYTDVLEVYGNLTFSENMIIDCMPKIILADVMDEIFMFGIKIHRSCHLTSGGHTLPPLLIEYIP